MFFVVYHCISLYIPIVQDIPIVFACIFSWVNPHGPWFFPQVLLISGYRHLCLAKPPYLLSDYSCICIICVLICCFKVHTFLLGSLKTYFPRCSHIVPYFPSKVASASTTGGQGWRGCALRTAAPGDVAAAPRKPPGVVGPINGVIYIYIYI